MDSSSYDISSSGSSSSYWDSSDSSSSSYEEPPKTGIYVTFSTTVPEKHPLMYAYSLKVEVEPISGYADKIFVFRRSKEDTEGNWVDEFIQIASPLEIEEVPEDAPDLLHNMPYYRTNRVVLYFRNMEDLELAKENIRNDIRTLITTYDILNEGFDRQETEHYG